MFKKINAYLIFLLIISGFTSTTYASCIGVGCTCTIAATGVNFGTYSPLSSVPSSSAGTVSVTCSALLVGLDVSYVIGLNKGSATNFSPRVMQNGTNHLNYNLYTDTLHTLIWGDGTGGTNTVSDSYLLNVLSMTRNYTAYGLLPALQTTVVPGNYSDTITATVTF